MILKLYDNPFFRPKIVPVDYNKKKQVCVCEQCGGSWSRKEYYYHQKVIVKILYFSKNNLLS